MQIFPAIDLRGGQVVRLYQGDYDQETVYRDGSLENFDSIAAIARQGGLFIESVGGMRTE